MIQAIIIALRATYLAGQELKKVPEKIRVAKLRRVALRAEEKVREAALGRERKALYKAIRYLKLDITRTELTNAIGYYMIGRKKSAVEAHRLYRILLESRKRYPAKDRALKNSCVRLRQRLDMLTQEDEHHLEIQDRRNSGLKVVAFLITALLLSTFVIMGTLSSDGSALIAIVLLIIIAFGLGIPAFYHWAVWSSPRKA